MDSNVQIGDEIILTNEQVIFLATRMWDLNSRSSERKIKYETILNDMGLGYSETDTPKIIIQDKEKFLLSKIKYGF